MKRNHALKEATPCNKLKNDALDVCGGLYSANAPHAIGYLFCQHATRHDVAIGMFCHNRGEINPDEWDWFYDFKTEKFYKIS